MTPAGLPDPLRIKRNASVIFRGAGETATLRYYVSASAGAPEYGIANDQMYGARIITGLFKLPSPKERAEPGGMLFDADLAITVTTALDSRDRVQWRGSAYTVAGGPYPVHLGGRTQYHHPLKFSNATG